MKSQPLLERVYPRLGLVVLVAGLALVAGGCASNGTSASYQWDRMARGEPWEDANWWSPSSSAWPPDDWIGRPLAEYYDQPARP